MSFDGVAEAANILTALQTLAGGRWWDSLQDDAQMSHDVTTGTLRPYGVVIFGAPIPTATDRGMAVGERGQPHIMPITTISFGATAGVARALGADVSNLLLDFLPNGGNASGLKAAGGYSFTKLDPLNKPSRFDEMREFTTVINLST